MHRPQPPVDIEPEPEPVACTWCGLLAYFEEDATDEERATCPACAHAYEVPPPIVDSPELMDTQQVEFQIAIARRQAFALDRIADTIQEAFDTFVPPDR